MSVRRDVDAEDRQTIESWFDDVIKALQSADIETRLDYLSSVISDADEDDDSASGPTRERPHLAALVVRRTLSSCAEIAFGRLYDQIFREFAKFGAATWHWAKASLRGFPEFPQIQCIRVQGDFQLH